MSRASDKASPARQALPARKAAAKSPKRSATEEIEVICDDEAEFPATNEDEDDFVGWMQARATTKRSPPGSAAMLFLMYFASPFFGHPLKALLQAALGAPYARAYRHFRSNHTAPDNIAIHLAALALILSANFALLALGDRAITGSSAQLLLDSYYYPALLWLLHTSDAILPGVPVDDAFSVAAACPLAVSVACSWALLIALAPAPRLSRLAAVGAVGVAFAQREALLDGSPPWVGEYWCSEAGRLPFWRFLLTCEAVLQAAYWKGGDGKALPCFPARPFLLLLALRGAAEWLVVSSGLVGALTPHAPTVAVVALALLAHGCVGPFAKAANCYWAAPLGVLMSLLTEHPAYFFYGVGYAASLCQGVGHVRSGEAANLPELARRSGPQKAADEHAHTAYFPLLILHSAQESLIGA